MKKTFAVILLLFATVALAACNREPKIKDVSLKGLTISYDGLSDTGDFEKDYYLQRNTPFVLNIYLNNDLDLEITNIKVNGIEFGKDEFVEGYSNTLISVNLNTGSKDENFVATIDEITFINQKDKSDTATVNMNNDLVINIQARFTPVILVASEEPAVLGFTLNLNVTDRSAIIDFSEDNAILNLYDGEELISEHVLNIASNTIELTNLKADHLYTYTVVANYDINDGEGVKAYNIFDGNFKTNKPFDVSVGPMEETRITFDYEILDSNITLDKIDLELNGLVEKNIPTDATSIEALEEGLAYELAFHYTYIHNGKTITNRQVVDSPTFILIMTQLLRNGRPVPMTGGGYVEIPNYRQVESELRAIWFSTVANIDIAKMQPGESGMQLYKDVLRLMFDNVKAANMNAVFFQIRPMNDAWYESELAPWSRYITGKEGVDPGFDVLAFAIEEAHARGIELHGWLNPYRVGTSEQTLLGMHESNFAYGREDLWLQGTTNDGAVNTILDPGIPEVQQYIIDVIDEIMVNYPAINGIHFDDYFYLSESMIGENENSPDYGTYLAHREGSESFHDFRINSVTKIIRDIYNNVEAFNAVNNSHIRFGISPSGIWDNLSSNPLGSNTNGMSHLRSLHADTVAWINEGIVHYMVPQIYWDFDRTVARYANLVDWWSEAVRGTDVDLIIGMGPYRLRETAWPVRSLEEQLRFNQLYTEVKGSAFFTYQDLAALQPQRLVDAMNIIKDELWVKEALLPWETNVYDNE